MSPLVVNGAMLWGMDGEGATQNATIVIEGGKVAAVGVGLPAPQGARVIEAGGAIVTPGLMNGATQLGLVDIGGIEEWAEPPSGEREGRIVDVRYALNANSTPLPRARADGLTRALVFPARPDRALVAGLAAVIRLSEGPDLLDRAEAAALVTIGEIGANAPGGPRGALWRRLRAELDGAREDASSVLRGVVDGRMPLMIQAGRESDVRQAAALARDYGIRVVVFGAAEAWRCADLLAEHDVAVVLNPFDNIPATVDAFGARSDNAAILARAGVAIAFSVPGIHLSHNAGSASREAAGLAVANGLPWEAALRSVTITPARIFGVADHYGALAVGMDADVVVWDGDPLEPASGPTTVIVRGVPASLATRQSLLRDRYRPQETAWPPAYR